MKIKYELMKNIKEEIYTICTKIYMRKITPSDATEILFKKVKDEQKN